MRIPVLCLFSVLPIATSASNLHLTCERVQSTGDEAKLIHQFATDVAVRHSRHELRIKIKARTLKFADKPPHDEPLSGLHYLFCDRKDGFILVQKDEEGLFTGSLINEETGEVTPGGLDVFFSADKRAYLTVEQPDGLDGTVWKIYAVNGKLSWSGYSFIPQANDSSRIYAYLGQPTWTQNGEFTAEAQCVTEMERKWKVKLTKINGRWDWHPKKKCPESSK